MNLIEEIEKSKLKEELPSYKAGDTVKVNVKVSEGNQLMLRFLKVTVKESKHLKASLLQQMESL
mgnify:CR=1 FL=1